MSVTKSGQIAPDTLVLTPDRVRQFLEEQAILGETERFRQLDRYEAFYENKQYDHHTADWWGRPPQIMETISPVVQLPPGFTGNPDPSLSIRDKKPTAPSGMCRTIASRFTSLLFSRKRRPKVTCPKQEGAEVFLKAAMKQSKFWQKFRAARNKGGASGSVGMTFCVRGGQFQIEVWNTKHVTVVWKDRATWTPLAFLISYLQPMEVPKLDERGLPAGTEIIKILYRRIITEAEDIVYKPVRFDGPNVEVAWEPDPYLYVKHDFGFFPGIWIQNHEQEDDPDGSPDCDGSWQMIDTYDRMVSQMNHGTVNNLDPTLVLKYDPKVVNMVGGLRGVEKGSSNAFHVGKDGDANYAEMTGAGITAGEIICNRLKRDILDLTRCVLVDPKDLVGAAQSGFAIELTFEPMIECADELRDQYGDAIVAALETMARMYVALNGKVVTVPGVGQARIVFVGIPDSKFDLKTLQIDLGWGPYFSPTEDDNSKRITNAIAAKTASLVDNETASGYVADVFGIEDVAGMVKRAAGEQDAALDEALSRGMVLPARPNETKSSMPGE